MYIGQDGEQITLSRDVEAIQVPTGNRMKLPAGTTGTIMQALGGTYTVITSDNYMVRIQSKDADALGKEVEAELEKPTSQNVEDVEAAVWDLLRTVYDPEIPVNIADLGLVYGCRVKEIEGSGNRVEIEMTLTAPGCGMGDVLKAEVESKLDDLPGVNEYDVQLVFDPPWDYSMIPDAAKLTLGMM